MWQTRLPRIWYLRQWSTNLGSNPFWPRRQQESMCNIAPQLLPTRWITPADLAQVALHISMSKIRYVLAVAPAGTIRAMTRDAWVPGVAACPLRGWLLTYCDLFCALYSLYCCDSIYIIINWQFNLIQCSINFYPPLYYYRRHDYNGCRLPKNTFWNGLMLVCPAQLKRLAIWRWVYFLDLSLDL